MSWSGLADSGEVGRKLVFNIWAAELLWTRAEWRQIINEVKDFPSPPLDNIWVMMIVWRLRGNIIRTALWWIVWHNVHSQQHTYVSSSFRSNRLGLSHWDPYAVHRGDCLQLYYCNMVEWFRWDSSLIFDDQLVSFSALTLLVWSSGVWKSSLKWPTMCWVGR